MSDKPIKRNISHFYDPFVFVEAKPSRHVFTCCRCGEALTNGHRCKDFTEARFYRLAKRESDND